jgi:alkylated DNA repair dioxygenase AlkB
LNRSLFEQGEWENIVLPGSEAKQQLRYMAHFLSPEASTSLFDRLLQETPWQQEQIRLYGKQYLSPRLTAWYGDADARYGYSGIEHEPLVWTDSLRQLKSKIETLCDASFNSVLLNLYRDGQDRVGWHSDDEMELGPCPVIASLSLGENRRFLLKPKKPRRAKAFEINLSAGSLLLMGGSLQHHWKHCVPREKQVHLPRINLTFRRIREQ